MRRKDTRLHRIQTGTILTILWLAGIAQAGNPNDADGDGVLDDRDNCLLTPNPAQVDANDDGFGNTCDMDLNDDGVINVTDLGLLRAVFFTDDPVADANSDGIVNVVDLGVLRAQFFGPPGPTRFVRRMGDGLWSDPTQWRPARVPLPTDHVLVELADSQAVGLDTDAVVTSLELRTGILAGAQALEVTDALFVTGTSMSEFQDVQLSVGGLVQVDTSLRLEGGQLTLADAPLSIFNVTPSGMLDITAAQIDVARGINNQGNITLFSSSGTLGGITGAGNTSFSQNTLRLVGTHTGGYVRGQNNTYTLAGTVDGTGTDFIVELTDGVWTFEPDAILRNVFIQAMNYTLDAPGVVTILGGDIGGRINVSPATTLALGNAPILGGSIVLTAPTTAPQGAPALRFIDGNPSNSFVQGSGEVLIPASGVPGLSPAHIEFDAPGQLFVIESSLMFNIERSTTISTSPGTQVQFQNNLLASNAHSAAALRIEGDWVNAGLMTFDSDFDVTLAGGWANIPPGQILAQNSSVALTGEWANDAIIVITDGSIDIGPLDSNLGTLNLVRSVARLSGEINEDDLAFVTSDIDSRIEFGGTLAGSPSELDLDNLPAGFTLAPGGQLEFLDVVGDGPLLATGGRLDGVNLMTDLHILNGATVAATALTLIDHNVLLLADDAPTTLLVPDDGFGGIAGGGDIIFAGTTLDDTHNTIRTFVRQIGSQFDLRIVTSGTGGRIVFEDRFSGAEQLLFADLVLETPDRTVVVDAELALLIDGDVTLATDTRLELVSENEIRLDSNLTLGAGAALAVGEDATLAPVSQSALSWATVLDPVRGSGRIEGLNGALPDVTFSGVTLLPTFDPGFSPSECQAFDIGLDARFNGTFDAVDDSALAPFTAQVEELPSLLRMTLDGAACP